MLKYQGLDRNIYNSFYGKFPNLRPAQIAAIEPILSEKDLILSAGTGTGKTEAVVAPLLSKFWRHAIKNDCLVILYIAPTKALVNDLQKRLQINTQYLGLKVGIRHGDQDDFKKSKTPHVLITTPESFEVLVFRKERRLESVRVIIIDEVHLLYNTQRGLQLAILIKRLEKLSKCFLQIVALSATIGELAHIRDFLFPDRDNVEYLNYESNRNIDCFIDDLSNYNDLKNLISKLLTVPRKLLFFANSRKECEKITSILKKDNQLNHFVFTHYSSLSVNIRMSIEKKFAAQRKAICISTSTLELGIDIGDIDAVILWGAPDSVESFLQRIGRGNRRKNKTNVICLVPPEKEARKIELLKFIALYECASKGIITKKFPYSLFGSICQQTISYIGSNDGEYTKISGIYQLIDFLPYLSRELFEEILSELSKLEYIQHHGFKNKYGAKHKLYLLQDYRLIYGNFGQNSQMIPVYHSSHQIGEVPLINLLKINTGRNVRFAGKTWRIKKCSLERIDLFPSSKHHDDAIDFIYLSTKFGSETFILNAIWREIHFPSLTKKLFKKQTFSVIQNYINNIKNSFGYYDIPVTLTQGKLTYYTFAGYLVNKAIALRTKQAFYDIDDLYLSVIRPVNFTELNTDPESYRDIFTDLFESQNEQSIYQKMLPKELQISEFIEGWIKDIAIKDVLERLAKSVPKECPHFHI